MTDTTVLSPAERLTLSRARLRTVLFPPPVARSAPSTGTTAHWVASLKKLPGVDLLIDTAEAWWTRHPLKPVSRVANEASKVALGPVAKEHPFLLLIAAASVGGLIALFRPWRWALRSALFAGLLPQILSKTVSKLPIESWFKMLAGAMAERPARARPVVDTPVASPAATRR